MRLSKWQTGVQEYADELVEMLEYNKLPATKENMLNGASDWFGFSYGGCSLVYNDDIAERLATPSEIKKRTLKDGLSNMANSNETWLDVQARALSQACNKVLRNTKEI